MRRREGRGVYRKYRTAIRRGVHTNKYPNVRK